MTTTRTDAAAQTDLALNSSASVASLYATSTLDLTDWRELADDALLRLVWGLDDTATLDEATWLVARRHCAIGEATIDLLVREAVG